LLILSALLTKVSDCTGFFFTVVMLLSSILEVFAVAFFELLVSKICHFMKLPCGDVTISFQGAIIVFVVSHNSHLYGNAACGFLIISFNALFTLVFSDTFSFFHNSILFAILSQALLTI